MSGGGETDSVGPGTPAKVAPRSKGASEAIMNRNIASAVPGVRPRAIRGKVGRGARSSCASPLLRATRQILDARPSAGLVGPQVRVADIERAAPEIEAAVVAD